MPRPDLRKMGLATDENRDGGRSQNVQSRAAKDKLVQLPVPVGAERDGVGTDLCGDPQDRGSRLARTGMAHHVQPVRFEVFLREE